MTVVAATAPARTRRFESCRVRPALPQGMHGFRRLLCGIGDRATVGGTDGPRFVCPFCGRTFDDPVDRCDRCGGRPVVRADERAVYERVVALCGPRYDGPVP